MDMNIHTRTERKLYETYFRFVNEDPKDWDRNALQHQRIRALRLWCWYFRRYQFHIGISHIRALRDNTDMVWFWNTETDSLTMLEV